MKPDNIIVHDTFWHDQPVSLYGATRLLAHFCFKILIVHVCACFLESKALYVQWKISGHGIAVVHNRVRPIELSDSYFQMSALECAVRYLLGSKPLNSMGLTSESRWLGFGVRWPNMWHFPQFYYLQSLKLRRRV